MADETTQGLLRAWQAEQTPEALNDAGVALVRARQLAELLELLLEAYASYRLPALGAWAQQLGLICARPELQAVRKKAKSRIDTARWKAALELCATPADRSVLIELLPKAKLSELAARVEQVAKWGTDPRLVWTLSAWVKKPPYTSNGFNKAWQALNDYLADHGDAQTVKAYGRHMQTGINAPYSRVVSTRGSGKAVRQALVDAGRDAVPARPEALIALKEVLAEALGVRLEPATPSWLRD